MQDPRAWWNQPYRSQDYWGSIPMMSQSEIDYFNQGRKDFEAMGSAIANFGNQAADWLFRSNPFSSAINKFLDLDGSQAAKNQYNAQLALQKDAQEFNASEAEKARQFEAQQSATAYQRAVSDMKAAGLNPYWLNSMQGASTGSGSAASIGSGSASMANNKIVMAAGLIATALRMFLTKGK